MELQVVTWNVDGWHIIRDEQLRLLDETSADVALLQEVPPHRSSVCAGPAGGLARHWSWLTPTKRNGEASGHASHVPCSCAEASVSPRRVWSPAHHRLFVP